MTCVPCQFSFETLNANHIGKNLRKGLDVFVKILTTVGKCQSNPKTTLNKSTCSIRKMALELEEIIRNVVEQYIRTCMTGLNGALFDTHTLDLIYFPASFLLLLQDLLNETVNFTSHPWCLSVMSMSVSFEGMAQYQFPNKNDILYEIKKNKVSMLSCNNFRLIFDR